MAGQPLSPATRLRLGEPLPHQQAGRTRASPLVRAEARFTRECRNILETIRYYPPFPVAIPVQGVSYPSITHPFAALLVPEGTFALDLHA